MDHAEAVRQGTTEKYLLNELDGDVRDAFEEHLFDCQDCAIDVRAAVMFIEQSKVVLSESSTSPVPVPVPGPARAGWFQWFRPVFALPVLALLLAVLGYQNLITYPQLKEAVNTPQVLPWASVNLSTRGSDVPVIAVPRGNGFLLFVRIPPESRYSHYTADLHNPAGKLEWSLTIPPTSGEDMWPVQVPAGDREPGKYTIVVNGISADGKSTEIGFPAPFELQIQK
jgi:hypothetical protein